MADMMRLVYAGTEVLTGSDIALAVLRCCEALVESGRAEVVRIPVLSASGSRVTASMVIGPASQMIVVEAEDEHDELVDAELVSFLDGRARAQRPGGYQARDHGEHEEIRAGTWHDDYL